MTAINFPDSPTNGQTFTSGSTTWTWDGVAWSINPTILAHANSHGSGGTDPVTVAQSQVTGLSSSLSAKANVSIFSLPQTSGTAQWINLGTFSASQDGHSLVIKIVSKQGYNASVAQNQYTILNFKTANGSSFIAGSTGNFLGDATARVDTLLGPNSSTPSEIRIVQNSVTSYTVFGFFDPFTGLGSFYEVYNSAGSTWTNSSTLTVAPTGNFIVVPIFSDTRIVDLATNYTIVGTDRGQTIRSVGGAITITVANVLRVGDRIDFIQDGTGQITFTPGSGATLQSKSNNRKTATQYSAATLICVASGQYRLIGDIVA
jgi:hypothetical protein